MNLSNNNTILQQTSPSPVDIEMHEDPDFSYDGYQVVRGEFFAHLFEPSVCINHEKVSVNTACLRKLSDVEYVQFLVNPTERKLAVKPCTEDTKDSFKWATGEGKNRKPRLITCKIFYAKLISLMGWSTEYRYKILGKLIRTKTDLLFVFDLNSAETYKARKIGSGGRGLPLYPAEWKNQFGIPVKEHQDTYKVNIFDDYAVFRINREEEENGIREETEDDMSKESSSNTGHEEAANTDT